MSKGSEYRMLVTLIRWIILFVICLVLIAPLIGISYGANNGCIKKIPVKRLNRDLFCI